MKMRLPVHFESPDDPLFLAALCRMMRLTSPVIIDGERRDLNPLRDSLAEKLAQPQFRLTLDECIFLSELLNQYAHAPMAKQKARALRLQKAFLACIDPVVEALPAAPPETLS